MPDGAISEVMRDLHTLEQDVRRGLLEQIRSQAQQVVGTREIVDLSEAFAWLTNPAQGHGARA